jgi:hypothetical protein
MLERWRKLSGTLRDTADQVERTIDEVRKQGIARLHYPKSHHPATVMREFATFLGAFQKGLRPVTTHKSGGNEILVRLCYLVKAATGRRHYQEIAAIISVFEQRKVETKLDLKGLADAIRNRVARYGKEIMVEYENEKRNPLQEEAEDEVAEWRKSH